MLFINPLEILQLETANASEVDNAVIKKAKRKLFADIDLSDNEQLEYKGSLLTKTDCERVIDQLDDQQVMEFYRHLAGNKELNDFLVNGSENIFHSFRQESIYQLPEFIKFVSPYFATRFDKALVNAFNDKDESKLQAVLRTQALMSTADQNTGFKSLGNLLQDRITQVDQLTDDFKAEKSGYTEETVSAVTGKIKTMFPAVQLNQLPPYFQSQVNKIADAINYLQLSIWQAFNTTPVPLQLLEHVLSLNTESVSKPTFLKNYDIIKKKHEDRIEQEKNAPALKQWAEILNTIKGMTKGVEDKSLKGEEVYKKIRDLISVKALNNMPPFANEIRSQLCMAMRSLAVSFWNKQNDIVAASELVEFALKIDTDFETTKELLDIKKGIKDLEEKYQGMLVCDFCGKNPPDDGHGMKQTIYKVTSRGYNSVQYKYIDFTIPRCKHCKTVHGKAREKFYLFFICGAVMGLLLGAVANMVIVFLLLFITAGIIVGIVFQNKHLEQNRVKKDSYRNLKRHPMLLEKMAEGWTFNKPSA